MPLISRRKTVRTRRSQPKISGYDVDFVKWTQAQAACLKKQDFSHLDIENLVEEIESLGKSDKRSLKNHAINLLLHLLKQKYQPENHGKSWVSSISNAKREIAFLLADSPSLKNELKRIFPLAYQFARKDASQETGINISKFPLECPWSIEEALDES